MTSLDGEGSGNSPGVMILISKKKIQFKFLKQIKDNSGRVIIVLAEIQGKGVTLANTDTPNCNDQASFVNLEGKLLAMGFLVVTCRERIHTQRLPDHFL